MTSETKKSQMLSTIEEVKVMRKEFNEMLMLLDDLILELTEKLEGIE